MNWIDEKVEEFKMGFDVLGTDGVFSKSVEELLWLRTALQKAYDFGYSQAVIKTEKREMEKRDQMRLVHDQQREDAVQEALAKVEEWVKEKTEDLETLNDPYTNCNPRCHDSGKEAIADDLLDHLQQLKDNK